MKKSIKTILSVVLVTALIGTNCVFAADSASKELQRVQVATTFYNANGGSCSVTDTVNNVGSPYGSLPTPTRSGYVFTGWFPNDYSETIEVTGNTIVTAGNHQLYAHWGYPRWLSNVGAGKCLNIDGSNLTSLYNGMNVTLWSNSGSNEQKWLWDDCFWQFYLNSYVDRAFGLNVHRVGNPFNCNIRRIIGNETDAQLCWEYALTNDGFPCYRIGLSNYSLYLTAAGSSNGANVYWAQYDQNNEYQLWH